MSLYLLQVPKQDGSELLILLIIGVIVTALSAYFVYNDATKRDNENATLWTVGTILGGLLGNIIGVLIVVILYLIIGRE